MTVIRNNSISGINSITAQSSSLNFYDSTGNTLSIGADVTGGVTVATGATISGSTNTIVASTNGSERVRIDSTGDVGIGTDNPGYKVHVEGTGEVFINVVGDVAPAGGGANLRLQNKNTTASALNQIQSADAGGQTTSAISFYNVDNTTNEGYMMFLTRPSGGGPTEAARFTSSGNLRFPSGQGIDFSATSDASGSTSELLDDYEEGNWTPTYSVASGTITAHGNTSGRYVKIGRNVYIWGYISYQSHSSASGNVSIGGLPFTSGSGFGQASVYSGGVFSTGNYSFLTNTPQYGTIESSSTSIIPLSPRSGQDNGFLQLNFSDFDTRPNYSQFRFAGQYLT